MLRASMLAVLALVLTPLPGWSQFGGMGGRGGETQEYAVKVEMAGGQSVTGEIPLSGVEIDCDFGRYLLKPEKVESIEFSPPKGELEVVDRSSMPGGSTVLVPATVHIKEGDPITGTIRITGDWYVSTDLGRLRLDPAKLKRLTFTQAEETASTTLPFPPVGLVKGTIHAQGKPLEEGKIRFHSKSGETVEAAIDTDGRFSAEVPVGESRVTVASEGASKELSIQKPSNLRIHVLSGSNTFDVNLPR